MTEKKIALLFEKTPSQWGLRGDPYLWQEMTHKIGQRPLPNTERQMIEQLTEVFEELVAFPITHSEDIYLDRMAHGGMSGGYISPRFWREIIFPLLLSRYKENQIN